ncbi:unnamed protein product [Caenorhabditis angaria]|uniref:snRNA-activating protein complex subunit 1 n=1 Tax=Caenorhabditis angaria TaxID=860376 RepID=A0A9P1N0Y3_9PELO|nr:unnamed protein product [Caenorhabditis angaria]
MSNQNFVAPFISAGVRQDLHALFNKFNQLDSVRLSYFTSIFRDVKFDTILHHRISPAEYREHVEFVLQQSANYFRTHDDYQNMRTVAQRIFGIYTTYALYHCQPLDQICKIRVTTQQLRDLLDFEKYLISEKHLDAAACIHVLIAKQAFHICLFQSSYDPACHKKYMNEEETWKIAKVEEPFDCLRKLAEGEVFNEMCLLHRSYIKGKEKFGIKANYIDTKNPLEMLRETIETHQRLLKVRQETGRVVNLKQQPNSEDEGEAEDRAGSSADVSAGNSRGDARNKAYTSKFKHTRNRRYLDPNMEENFGHLKTFGDLAQEILEEEEEEDQRPSTSTFKSPEKKRRKKRGEDIQAHDEDAEAAEVLRNSLDGIFNPEGELEAGNSKNSKKTARKAPKRKENANIISVPGSEEGETRVAILSPEKKPNIPEQWTSRLRNIDKVKSKADKALERIESRIKKEEESGAF